MPKGWRKPLFKSWPEVEGCVQDRGWLWVRRQLIDGGEQIPNPATAGRKLSWWPRGNETGVAIQECTETSRAHWKEGRLVYKPFRIAFSKSVFFFLFFQSYFIFVCILVKLNLKSWEVLDVLTFKEDGAVSSKLWPTQGFVRQAIKIKHQLGVWNWVKCS